MVAGVLRMVEVNRGTSFASTPDVQTDRSRIVNDVDTRRLTFLLELSRRGSMRAVAEDLGYTTSTVSQQLALLAREAGTPLLEPDGRNVRLTPAGRRLAEHAVTILAAIDAARADLAPEGDPAGIVRVAGFASGIRRTLVPTALHLRDAYPDVHLRVHEHEPDEALAALDADAVDLAMVYDYDLAPLRFDRSLQVEPLWTTRWSLAVADDAGPAPRGASAPQVLARFADADWIVNSRNTADEDAVRTIASIGGFEPRIANRVDSLELVQELILAGLGVGLLPADQPTADGVRLLALRDPAVVLRSFLVVRRGRERWPPIRLVAELLRAA